MKKYIIAYGIPVIISIVVGFLFWKITNDKASSFLCALLINATILLIEQGSYIRKSQDIFEYFSNPYFEKKYINSLFSNLNEIQKAGIPLLFELAEEEVNQCSLNLLNLRNKHWVSENIREFLIFFSKLSGKKLCKNSYVATSISSEYINFWKTKIGKQIFTLNIEAVKRGIDVKRVFILNADEFSELSTIMEKQAKNGIDVRYIFREDIREQIEIIDYAIWDGSISTKIKESRYFGEDFKAEFYFKGKVTDRLNQHFKTLYNASTTFEILK